MENINVDLLVPHPNNPREDLGDLTELAESIKTQGILQNLTVNDDGNAKYTVIIGHRRLAAAKLAGITEVPCTIVKMDPATQASTMLLENMQRTDLTPYEQAQGFQMCLDLGMSEDTLKEKTGFGKKTIKHRLQLLKLDQAKFKKGVGRGATLQDYIDLEQIDNQETKSNLLDVIGTKDYRFKLNNELNAQLEKKTLQDLIEKLEEVMEQVDEIPDGYEYITFLYGISDISEYTIPSDTSSCKYVFTVQGGRSIQIYKEGVGKKEIKSYEPEPPTQIDLNIIEIKKKSEVAFQTRLEFAKGIYSLSSKNRKIEFEIKYAFDIIANSIESNGYDDEEIFEQVTGKVLKNIKLKNLSDDISKACIGYLFALIYANLDNSANNFTVCTWDYNGQYGKYSKDHKDKITTLYGFLEYYGYQSSEEENAIMFGTHPLYVKDDDEEEGE